MNEVREKLKRGEATIGTYLGLGSPNVTELVAGLGFDWLVIETEHNAVDLGRVEHMLMAMRGTDAVPLVRVPSGGDPSHIQRALDIGAKGVVVPMVRTAAEAREVAAAAKYPPAGRRSFGPLRASQYTQRSSEYFDQAPNDIMVVLILETAEAAGELEEIVQVDGIDAIYLGPADLSLSFGGHPLKTDIPEVREVLENLLRLGRKHNVAVGCGANTATEIGQAIDHGVTMIGYSTDYAMLARSANTGLEQFSHESSSRTGTTSVSGPAPIISTQYS